MRKNWLATASAVALAAAALSGCVAPSDIQSSGDGPPGNGWYRQAQAEPAPAPPPVLGATFDLGPIDANPPPARMQADAKPNSEPQQQEAATDDALPVAAPRLSSDNTAHDLEDAAGGYIVGRQVEHVARQYINRRKLAAAAKDAAEVGGAGAAMTRTATGGRAATALERGAAAAEGEEGAAVAGRTVSSLGAGAAASEGEGAAVAAGRAGAAALRGGAALGEAAGGEALVEGGLAAGASELIIPGLIIGGAAVLGYELYQHLNDGQKKEAR